MDFITLLLPSPLLDGSFTIPLTFIVRASYSVYGFCLQPQQRFLSLKCSASTGCSQSATYFFFVTSMSDTVGSLCYIIFCSHTFQKIQKNLTVGAVNNLCQFVFCYLCGINGNRFISTTSGIRQNYPINLSRIKLINYVK
jgi:hypothetical protein